MASFTLKRKHFGLILAALLGALCAVMPEALANGFLPLPDGDLNVPAPEGNSAIEKAEDILGPVARIARVAIAAIAVLLIVIAGTLMVIQGDNEETYKTQRNAIKFALIGLMMISIAGPLAEVFDFRQGNIFEDPDSFVERAGLFNDTTRLIVTFIKYLLGSLAALMFIRAGATMITGGHSEETITREKKNLALAAGGLLMVIMSDLVVSNILFDTEYSESASQTVVAIDQNEFVRQVVAITNLIVSFVGPILMLGLIAGGVLYITAGGDEERTGLAKKIMLNSVIGIAIIYGAFAIVSTVISGTF